MHQIQNNILRNLLFKEKLRFSALNNLNISNDHYNFHLKRLIARKLIEKDEKGLYSLTSKGKEYANRLNTDLQKVKIERQAKTSCLVVCLKDFGQSKKFLMQQRLKHPYFGFYGFVSGKIRWGETIYEAASRELKEEAGLKAKLVLAGIEHKIDYSKDDKLLEDKYFYILRGTKISGKLQESFEGGRNIWIAEKETKKLPDLFSDVIKIIDIVKKGKLTFFENKYKETRY